MASWLFLLVSIWGAMFTLAALKPAKRNKVLFLPTFFMSWLTIELALNHLLFQVLATAAFWYFGAFTAWPGWVGLAITLVSWTVLVVLVRQGRASAVTMRDAIAEVAGEGEGPRVPLHLRLFPLVMRRGDVLVERNHEYSRVAGKRLRLDVYQPRSPAGPGERRPAILQIHGGGWVIGDKREQGIPLLLHLAGNGWVGFNANYRLSPGATFPDQLVDLKRAVAWIRAHADEYGVDPDFLCVTGGSAGGHLTALMALTANDPRYQPGFEDVDTSFAAAVPFYGVYDFTNRLGTWDPLAFRILLEPMVVKAFLAEEPEKFAAASPMDQVRPDAPPFLAIHGDRDTLAPVEDAREFVRLLREVSQQPVLYAELKGSQHAFDVFSSIRTVHVIEAVERFLHGVRTGRIDHGSSTEAVEAHVAERTGTEPAPAGPHDEAALAD